MRIMGKILNCMDYHAAVNKGSSKSGAYRRARSHATEPLQTQFKGTGGSHEDGGQRSDDDGGENLELQGEYRS